ncbi:MFS transporter [Candidatus Entotheonella serta]|nr:MFS transporter [Candidatus Entotheonella serta]
MVRTVSLTFGNRSNAFCSDSLALRSNWSGHIDRTAGIFSFGATVVVSPFAGVVVDRFDRRWVLIGADTGAGLMTCLLLLLYSTSNLQGWHLYLTAALTGVFEAFQLPAFTAATTMLVPKSAYTRVSGMRSLNTSIAEIGAPLLDGTLLSVIGLAGVMVIDLVSFLFAVSTLLWVRIPRPTQVAEAVAETRSTWRDMGTGFGFILQRPGLVGLLLIYAGINLLGTLTYLALMPTMVLARSGSDRMVLASVQAALGLGGLGGGLCVSLWGGPKRRIHGILVAAGISFLLGDFLFAIGREVIIWMVAAFVAAFFIPFIFAANRAIWQSKVPPALQGRVFSVQGMLQRAMMPVGYLVAGPLADHVFEPAMSANGTLTPIFGYLTGTGPGAGMALMFAGTAILVCAPLGA